MMTVQPANTTALPEVAMVRAIDSATGVPAASSSRWRKTMKSA